MDAKPGDTLPSLEAYSAFKSGLTHDQLTACKARDAHAAVLFVETHSWVADVRTHASLLEPLINACPKRVPSPAELMTALVNVDGEHEHKLSKQTDLKQRKNWALGELQVLLGWWAKLRRLWRKSPRAKCPIIQRLKNCFKHKARRLPVYQGLAGPSVEWIPDSAESSEDVRSDSTNSNQKWKYLGIK